jgi:hypothetical protein
MVKNRLIRGPLVILLTIVNATIGFSQFDSNTNSNYLIFELEGAITSPLKIQPSDSYLKSGVAIGGNFSIGYLKQFNNRIGIVLGGGFGVAPFSINYNIDLTENSPLYPNRKSVDLKYSDYWYKYIMLYVFFDYEFYQKPNTSLGVSAGINCNFFSESTNTFEDGYQIDGSTSFTFFEYYLDNIDGTIQPAIKLRVFASRFLKYDKITFGITANIALLPVAEGTYTIYGLEEEDYSGTLKHWNNYIGFSIRYCLNLQKKALKQLE